MSRATKNRRAKREVADFEPGTIRRLQDQATAKKLHDAKPAVYWLNRYSNAIWLWQAGGDAAFIRSETFVRLIESPESAWAAIDAMMGDRALVRAYKVALRTLPVIWRGPNLWAMTERGERWFMRLIAPGSERRGDELSLRDYFDAHQDHSVVDLNLGNGGGVPREAYWITGQVSVSNAVVIDGDGRDRLAENVKDDILDQPITVRNGHLYGIDRVDGRLVYLATDVELMESVIEQKQENAPKEGDPSNAVEGFLREASDQPIFQRTVLEEEVWRAKAPWLVTDVELADGFHYMLLSHDDLVEARARKDGTERVRTILSPEGYDDASEALYAAHAIARSNGVDPPVIVTPEVARSVEKLAKDHVNRENARRIKEKYAKRERQGVRCDFDLITWAGQKAGLRAANFWSKLPLCYIGPRQDEFLGMMNDLIKTVPRLDYLPWRDVVFDFGLNDWDKETKEIELMAGNESVTHVTPSLCHLWVRVAAIRGFLANSTVSSPWAQEMFEHFTLSARDPDDWLMTEAILHFPDIDSWIEPVYAAIKLSEWGDTFYVIRPGDVGEEWREEYTRSVRGAILPGVLALAYLAQMPEYLYEERNRPHTREPERKGLHPKPQLKQDWVRYIVVDPTRAPRPKKDPQGGTHASPIPHDRAGSRHTLFHPRYYPREEWRLVEGSQHDVKPLLAEVHYDEPRFYSGRDAQAQPHVYVVIGRHWWEVETRIVRVGPSSVNPHRDPFVADNNRVYRLVDPPKREKGVSLD